MIKKANRLIITFHTTAAAMEMEQKCKEAKLPGRLIPVPKLITAGCGLAWCANPEEKDMFCSFMEQNHLTAEAMHVCLV